MSKLYLKYKSLSVLHYYIWYYWDIIRDISSICGGDKQLASILLLIGLIYCASYLTCWSKVFKILICNSTNSWEVYVVQ